MRRGKKWRAAALAMQITEQEVPVGTIAGGAGTHQCAPPSRLASIKVLWCLFPTAPPASPQKPAAQVLSQSGVLVLTTRGKRKHTARADADRDY